ncbi:MAG: hypothetical protein K9W45_04930 [Candidatus Heimdallarchaeum aukensis]|uniref:Uncharacterized protein n=1 Tax=Candidatus Heimdallarchaeum aukensis TaxID=2876573 RepID=A0A9Y1BN17_9ARCH|nr:MAG: hypothetical protein K9W45_04930 [Candidatus Heimdallarchaeum aukensis]
MKKEDAEKNKEAQKKSKKEEKQEKQEKQEKRKRKREERKAKRIEGGLITWGDVKKFFLIIWRIIYAILKVVFAPFWYTGLLVVYIVRFLKERGDHALTEEDKKFLSLIPTLFFMMSLCISIIFILVYFDVFKKLWEWIATTGFWQAIGNIFVAIGRGIWIAIEAIFVKGIWQGLVQPLGDLLQGHDWISAMILLFALIILAGLGFLLFHATFMQKTVRAIRNFFKYIGEFPKKIAQFFVNIHNKIRQFVLNYLVGRKYIETMSKNFFWGVVLVEMSLALVFTLAMLIVGIIRYATGYWVGEDALRFGVFVSLIDFLFIGLFSTWFFIRILGVSVKGSDRYAIKT